MVRPRKKLGEMLIDSGIIEQSELEQALAGSRNAGMKLGRYLIRQGVVNEDTIVKVISEQVGIKQYNPNDFTITPDLSKIMSSENARRYQAVPVHKSGSILTVAMADPLDITAIDYIEVLTDSEVDTVICTEKDFNLLLNSIYGAFSGKGSVLDNIQEMGGTDNLNLLDENGEQTRAEDVADMASSLQNMAEEAPVIKFVNSIITQAVMDGASDIHISPEKDYVEIRFRVDGKLHDVPAPPKNMFLSIISRLKILANLDISISRIPQDGRFTVIVNNREINIRTSTIPTIYGENMVLRLFDTGSGIYSLGNLGVSSENIKTIEQAIKKPYGMILSTGPTGSGKSTCLFSMLKTINSRDLNIMTLEDPAEYRMEHIRQGQLNRKAGMTFAGGLRAILRQDPDVIMVGEIRDSETAGVAVQAALTGHLVLSTVHTNDAAGAITRLIDMGVEPFLVSSVMLVTIAQRLIRKACPHCRESYRPNERALRFWGIKDTGDLKFVRAKGCFRCKDTGYSGRTGLYEVLRINDEVRQMIQEGRTARDITKNCAKSGQLATLKMDAARKVASGVTTMEEAASAVMA